MQNAEDDSKRWMAIWMQNAEDDSKRWMATFSTQNKIAYRSRPAPHVDKKLLLQSRALLDIFRVGRHPRMRHDLAQNKKKRKKKQEKKQDSKR